MPLSQSKKYRYQALESNFNNSNTIYQKQKLYQALDDKLLQEQVPWIAN
jgi:hypothetical protein